MSDVADRTLPILPPEDPRGFLVPAIVVDTHQDAAERFLEFFAATIRNPNTRAAYMNAVADFLRFEPVAGLGSLAEIRPTLPTTQTPRSVFWPGASGKCFQKLRSGSPRCRAGRSFTAWRHWRLTAVCDRRQKTCRPWPGARRRF